MEIDGQLEAKTAVSGSIEISGELPRLEQYFTPQEAADREEDGEAEEIPWKESEGLLKSLMLILQNWSRNLRRQKL